MPIRGQDGTGQAQGEGGTRRGAEVQCSPEGLAVGGLGLRGLILAELTPFLSWSCLGWTGGVGGRCTQRLVRPPFPEQEASGACSQRLRLTPRLPGSLRALGLGETGAALGAVGPAARAPGSPAARRRCRPSLRGRGW